MSQKGAIVCYCICGINYSDVVGWEIIQDNCYRCRWQEEYRSHGCGRSHKEQPGSGWEGRRKHCNRLQLRQTWKPDKGYLWKWRLPGRYLRCKESEDCIEILSGRRNPDIANYFYEDGMVSYTTGADTGEKLIQNLSGLEDNVIYAERKVTGTASAYQDLE